MSTNYDMTPDVLKWQPSPIEAALYADYDIDMCDSTNPIVYLEQDGMLCRFPLAINRIPGQRMFRAWMLAGSTEADRQGAWAWLRGMPQGWWAYNPDKWFRRIHQTTNELYYRQLRGREVRADDVDAMVDVIELHLGPQSSIDLSSKAAA